MKCDKGSYKIAIVHTVHTCVVLVSAALLLVLSCFAQQPPVPNGQPTKTESSSKTMATIPAGTRISLQVMHPIATRLAHPGDSIDLQATMPVNGGDKVMIPAGTYIKGTLDKITRKHDQTELRIYLNSLIWPNGYSLPVINAVEVVTSQPGSIYEHVDYQHPGHGKALAVFAGSSFGGMAIGALAGGGSQHSIASTPTGFANPTPIFPNPPFGPPPPTVSFPTLPKSGFSGRVKGMLIGGAAGSAVGFVVAAIMSSHDRNVILDVGTPAELVLQNPITVDANRAADSTNQGTRSSYSPNQVVKRGGCAPGTGIPGTPGTSGTPDTVIPGTPATPPTVIPGAPGMPDTVIPGSPGTPDTVIPGTPGTAGTPDIPCVPVP